MASKNRASYKLVCRLQQVLLSIKPPKRFLQNKSPRGLEIFFHYLGCEESMPASKGVNKPAESGTSQAILCILFLFYPGPNDF